ncbi:sigma-70 family RNA polymerase sigma factor [Priestia endophytica]|uniref:RNA polymerase sigma factor n=1 Tax=Priestia endophytica TaxID=135735 RepID=A0AAX1QB05_9BACI|nr:sigma-70 family RNA polymerase sigma factor [Priestia endophytica]RAS79342.1 RNA polymerase sigma factor SigX [Priestia endophytica]RAS84015.1 RNA polymerase sigma factor SigX [Priestia endophytica]
MNTVLERLYITYHQDLLQFLVYTVKNREKAEDLAQEVYIRVLKSCSKFEGNCSEKTWLFTIAKNIAIDYFRKEKGLKECRLLSSWRKHICYEESPSPEEHTLIKEEIQQLYERLSTCKNDFQLVLLCRFIRGLSVGQTAHFLGWSESKVKTTQHRAIKALRAEMSGGRKRKCNREIQSRKYNVQH